jgi:hypothetical protein
LIGVKGMVNWREIKGYESVDWDSMAEERDPLYDCTLKATRGCIRNGKFLNS